jgi:putative ABC transport system substrate-binding protein
MANSIARRKFISALGGAVIALPHVARAQQPATPVVGFIYGGSADGASRYAIAFRKGLNETGYVEGQNVTGRVSLARGPLRSPAGAGG